ncbi:MAG: MerR family transcriptional regulator, partial [Anaerolineales bacterium]|nr:MerR family transcriptional regulator [Anaerolineales bacterium]
MTTLDTSPTFNLKVVVHETGVKPDTLRAWERRYGLPNPMRSEGRHRLYSPYDIQVILWLVARQTEGLSISRAAELWHSLVDAGKDPLQLYVDTGSPTTPEIPPTSVGSKIDDIRAAWIQACMQFDERQAEQILTHAFALYSPVMVCLEVLQKGLAQIGESWYRNTATVQQEHFASALAMRRINALVAAAPAPTRTERLVVACPAHEDHVFAPLLLTLILRYQGWDVVYLGANVPTTRLESLLESVEPDLLILTAQQLYTSANLLQLAEYVADKGHMLAFGGRIFNYIPQLRERIPGFFLGERLEGAARSVAQLLAQRPSPPPP